MDDVEPGNTEASISGAEPPVDANNQQQQHSESTDSLTCDTGTTCTTSVTTPDTVSTRLAIGLGSFYGKNCRNKCKPLRFDEQVLTNNFGAYFLFQAF